MPWALRFFLNRWERIEKYQIKSRHIIMNREGSHVGPIMRLIPFLLNSSSPSIFRMKWLSWPERGTDWALFSSPRDQANDTSLNPIAALWPSSMCAWPSDSGDFENESRSSAYWRKWLNRSRETFPAHNNRLSYWICAPWLFSPWITRTDLHEKRWTWVLKIEKTAMLEKIFEAENIQNG